MALDFTNRNPQDPNGIYSLDTSSATDAWVKDDDWSQIYYSQAEARKAGANNKVRVATAITNDGRKYNVVVGADGQPISQAGDTTGQDDDQARRWKDQQAAAAPPGGAPTKTINGQVFRWNPETRAYDIPTGEQPAPSAPRGGRSQIEGTPRPDGTFDNERPRMVTRDASGREVESRELTPAERKQWDDDREKSRNPGGKTDEQIQTEQRAADTTVESVVYEGKGRDRKKVTTYKSGRKLVEDAATNASPVSVTYDADGTKVTKYDDGSETREQLSPAQRRAEEEATKPKEARKPVQGKDGKQYTEVTRTDPKTGKTETYYEDEKGQRVTLPGSPMAGVKDVPPFTPNLMEPGAGLVARAKQLDELLAAGKITWEQRQQLLANDAETARTVAGEFNTATTLLRERYQAELTQRGQDMTQANNRASLANAHHQAAVGLVEKFAPYLGATAGDAGKLFVGMMASQLATATMYGGMKDTPRVEMDPRLREFADRKMDAALGRTPAAPADALGVGAVPAAVAPGAPATPAPPADPQAAARAEAEAVRQAHAASGQPLPPPLLGPQPMVGAPAPYQPTPAVTQTDPQARRMFTPEQIAAASRPNDYGITLDPAAYGHTPDNPLAPIPTEGAALGESAFGRSLPQTPPSWREEAEARLFALSQPVQMPGVALPGVGVSLPERYAPAFGGADYSLAPVGGAGMEWEDPITAEARRQLRAEGLVV